MKRLTYFICTECGAVKEMPFVGEFVMCEEHEPWLAMEAVYEDDV